MPIEFRCLNCNRLLRVGDDAAGMVAQCPECGSRATVPTPQAVVADIIPPGAPASDADNPYQSPTAPFEAYSPIFGGLVVEGKALTSLILGVAGLFLCFLGLCCSCLVVLTIPMGIAGIVLGAQSLRSPSRPAAIAGIIFSSIVLAISLMLLGLHGFVMAGGHHGMWVR